VLVGIFKHGLSRLLKCVLADYCRPTVGVYGWIDSNGVFAAARGAAVSLTSMRWPRPVF